MITIAIANEKGGVGKTTTAVTVASGLARHGYKTVLVDTDAQGHCALYLGLDSDDGLYNLLIKETPITSCITYANHARRLAVIRSSTKTVIAKTVLSAQRAPVDILKRALEPLNDYADFVVIDTAPSVDPLSLATLYASDLVLIPALCETLSLDGIRSIVNTIADLRNTYNATTALLGILPTKYRSNTNEHRENLTTLARTYYRQVGRKKQSLIYPEIPLATVIAESAAYQLPLWDYAPRAAATLAYQRVVEKVLADVKV
jgi:chromosome partitioning protein